MNKLMKHCFPRVAWLNSLREKLNASVIKPLVAKEIRQTTDKVTHTGQTWDDTDYRLQRFALSEKLVNPNFAQKLVAEEAAIECKDGFAYCDGGHGALGHPRVYINLDKPGNHACGYCGQRFFNPHVTVGEDRNINHYNC